MALVGVTLGVVLAAVGALFVATLPAPVFTAEARVGRRTTVALGLVLMVAGLALAAVCS